MNVKSAAQRTYGCALAMRRQASKDSPEPYPKATLTHLRHMNERIQDNQVTGEKAHRWLGWMQAVVYLHDGAAHEALQRINKEC